MVDQAMPDCHSTAACALGLGMPRRWGDLEFPLPFGRTMSPAEERIHEMDERCVGLKRGGEVKGGLSVCLSAIAAGLSKPRKVLQWRQGKRIQQCVVPLGCSPGDRVSFYYGVTCFRAVIFYRGVPCYCGATCCCAPLLPQTGVPEADHPEPQGPHLDDGGRRGGLCDLRRHCKRTGRAPQWKFPQPTLHCPAAFCRKRWCARGLLCSCGSWCCQMVISLASFSLLHVLLSGWRPGVCA